MLKGVRAPLKKQLDDLQHEILNIGVTLVIPRGMRLRMRDEEPETFPVHAGKRGSQDQRIAANMANCDEWTYLNRLM